MNHLSPSLWKTWSVLFLLASVPEPDKTTCRNVQEQLQFIYVNILLPASIPFISIVAQDHRKYKISCTNMMKLKNALVVFFPLQLHRTGNEQNISIEI